MGLTRAAVYAGSGTIDGPLLRGKVIPMSGGDFPLVRPDGVIDFDARYLLEAEDGTLIYQQNRGSRWAKSLCVRRRGGKDSRRQPDPLFRRTLNHSADLAGPPALCGGRGSSLVSA
jgi:hypothetical protein